MKPPLPEQDSSKKRAATVAALGASPKAKQRRISSWVQQKGTPKETPKEGAITASEVMNPSKPVLRSNQPSGSSNGAVKKWMDSFDVETQTAAKKTLQMLGEVYKREVAECSSSIRTQCQRVIEHDSQISSTSDFHCCSNDVLTSCLSYYSFWGGYNFHL